MDRRITPIRLDVTNQEDIQNAAREATDVDLLINNAGTLQSFSLLEATKEQLDHDFAVNFFGKLHVTRAFPDAMSKHAGEAWLSNPRSLEAMFAQI